MDDKEWSWRTVAAFEILAALVAYLAHVAPGDVPTLAALAGAAVLGQLKPFLATKQDQQKS